MSLRSPLGRARGLGSAKEGVQHFWAQRVSAVALIPLCLWFVFSVASLSDASYETVRWWVSAPSVAVVLVLFLGTAFYHAILGLQVVIEDYVHSEAWKLVWLLGTKFLLIAMAVASIFSVLKVALA